MVDDYDVVLLGVAQMLDPYRDHPAFGLTQRFCRDYDATSFDPGYDALPVEAFMPQIREIFERPYSFQA